MLSGIGQVLKLPVAMNPLLSRSMGSSVVGDFEWKREGRRGSYLGGGEERSREDDSGESLLLLLLFSRVWEHGDGKEDWEKVYSAQRIKFPFNTFSKRLKTFASLPFQVLHNISFNSTGPLEPWVSYDSHHKNAIG